MILQYTLPGNIKRYVYREGNNTVLSDELYAARNRWPARAVPGPLPACGIKTAQNVLDYFDIGLPAPILEPHFAIHDLPSWVNWFVHAGKWVYPSSLRGGVEECLHQYGCAHFAVRMQHGQNRDRVIEVLKMGYPVMALVDNGFHWVTVVGYTEDTGFDVLDNTSVTKRASIDMGFNGASRLYDWFTDTSFQAGTLLFIEESGETVAKEEVQ